MDEKRNFNLRQGGFMKKQICDFYQKILNFVPAVFEVVARLTIGIVFLESGWGKFKDLDAVVQYFESLQIPLAKIQAPFVSGVELVCGLLVIIGLMTRISSLLLVGTMVVALLTARAEEIMSVSDLLGQIEFLYLVIMIGLFAYGSKVLSVDSYFCSRKK
jgi:putative oxidoreductase